MLKMEKADGWMKTIEDKKEIIVDMENETLLWFFSPCASIDLKLNEYSKTMEAYSLLLIKDCKEKILTIQLSKIAPLIFGGIKCI